MKTLSEIKIIAVESGCSKMIDVGLIQALQVFESNVCKKERERIVTILQPSQSEILLMAGEMTAQELRTVNAVLNGLISKIIKQE